jgi:cytochrome c biogenesis protein CcmG, thiol:disulfide interchange protein DsbE
MQTLQDRYSAEGFMVIAVNVDEDVADAQKFLASIKTNFSKIFDPKGEIPARYGVQVMPSSFLVGRDGKIISMHRGFSESTRAEIELRLKEILGERR